ncbi:MAG TPA: transposase [Gemmataceae bacterium]|jgi:transposase|nr:transposase [Gemmataceae bacterium]
MNPTEPRLLRVEVVADLPVLWALFQRLDLPATLDRHFPAPPHWKGPLTPGEVLAVWLLFLVSQGDHCVNHVEPWVARHQGVLSALLGKPVLPSHAHDDRLADWLTRLSRGNTFAALERDLNQQTIRVYQLATELVRIDATTANSYADVLSEQGLLQFGHSKDDPDRPQLKIAAAVLDPLGLPLATAVVPGNTTDDPLYVPAIQAVQQSLGAGGRTYVGDCKMAALATRAFVAAAGDFYLCPLSENQLSRAKRQALLQPVWEGTQALPPVWRPGPEGQPGERVAEGFAADVALTAVVGGREVRWTERRWLVRSSAYAKAQEAALERRLARASAALQELVVRQQGKKQLFHADLMRAAEAIVKREGVEGLLSYTVQARMTARQVRAYRGRPARQETEVFFVIDVRREETPIEHKKREMGWQVYATNASTLVLPQVVWAYRGQYRIEDDWSRLKGRSLGLTPLYLQDEERIQGLVYLLSLALRVLTLVEWGVRERLREEGSTLQGIYAGQPGRKTARPSAELLLGAMKTISVSVVEVNGQAHALLAPLTEVQKRLLELWDLPPDLYEKAACGFPISPKNTSEP